MAVDGDGQVFVSVFERRGHGRDDVYFKHEEKGKNYSAMYIYIYTYAMYNQQYIWDIDINLDIIYDI